MTPSTGTHKLARKENECEATYYYNQLIKEINPKHNYVVSIKSEYYYNS